MLSFIPIVNGSIMIEFFLKESALYVGLIILSEVDETLWWLWTSEQQVKQLLKNGGRLLNDLFIKTVFSINILSSSFKNMVAFE